MNILGPIRFEKHEIAALKRGAITQWRPRAWEVDERCEGRQPTTFAKAKPGDLVWVQESFVDWYQITGWGHGRTSTLRERTYPGDGAILGDIPHHLGTRIHPRPRDASKMVAKISRLTLEIVSVRIERLMMISAADAEACGAELVVDGFRSLYRPAGHLTLRGETTQGAFRERFIELYGRESWNANPEMAVLTFTLIERNAWAIKNERDGEQGAHSVAAEALG